MYNYFNGKGTIGFICDVCGRELNSCSIVNGMKFCAKCYQETFGKDNQQNEIQQLKQQLTEKYKEIEKLKTKQKPIVMHSKEDYFKRCNFLEEANIKLQFAQTQLAIQELEKVEKACFNQKELVDFGNVACFMVDVADILEIINNQIKELKGE